MKKTITLICVSLFCSISIYSQMRKEGRDKIKALKIAYLSEQMDLSTAEAEKFWPIYNAHNRKQSKIRSNYKTKLKENIKNKGDINNLNEDEAKNLISLKLLSDKKLYESQKSFIEKIKLILPNKKIIKLQIAEMEFGRKLMRKYRRKNQN